jgi:primosomal protein N' (replication factor Y)
VLSANNTSGQHLSPADLPYADVALELPVQTTYQYAIPDDLRATMRKGSLVVVPVRSRQAAGCVVDFSAEKKAKSIKQILAQITPDFAVDEDLITLGKWLANYYYCGIGEALSCISFIGFHDVTEKTQRLLRLANFAQFTKQMRNGRPDLNRFTPKQRQVVAFFLESANEPIAPSELRTRVQVGPTVIRNLLNAHVLEETLESVDRTDDYPTFSPSSSALTLNSWQQEALENILQPLGKHRHHTFLLYGITGSGKTEVYLQSIANALAQGRQAIVLVPEIALTPQTVDRFRSRFGDIVGVYHSKLSLGQKYDLWRKIKQRRVAIVIGARSAVFSPFADLGLIVVDEEHEHTYKQNDTPRYHTRDVAVMRGKQRDAVVILGSATPSLESYHNTLTHKYTLLTLPKRVENLPLPSVELIDMTTELRDKDNPQILSTRLLQAIQQRLDANEQVILFLNRRGFSNFFLCLQCNHIMKCDRCDITMTYHRAGDQLVCHYCDRRMKKPRVCPSCQSPEVTLIGAGTQRVEDELAHRFPQACVVRVDLDTTTRRGSFIEKWRMIADGEVDIILGTQMIAKGFHLERVTLVGVVSADFSLYLPDFRSPERTFSLLTQVAGRTGRGAKPGHVIIQTYVPRHYSIVKATEQDYDAFTAKELRVRKILRFPPCYKLISIVCSGVDEGATRTLAQRLANIAKSLAYQKGIKDLTILGPAPSPIAKLRSRYRWRLLIRGQRSPTMHRLLDATLTKFRQLRMKSKVALTIDVDPLDLL